MTIPKTTPKTTVGKTTASKTTASKTAATIAAALLTLSLGLGAAQTTPQTPPQTSTQTLPFGSSPGQQGQAAQGLGTPGFFQPNPYASYKDVEKAAKAIEKAIRKAYEFDYARSFALSNAQVDTPQVAFLEIAQSLLQEAQEDYGGGQFFGSEKKAKAAEDLYKAAEHLYKAQGVIPPTLSGPRGRGPSGPGRGPSSRLYEAPYRAQEELFRLERESAFYNLEDARIGQLQRVASDLLRENVAGTNTNINTSPPTNPYGYSPFPALSYAEAAREVAKAGRHLLEGLRGF